MEQHTCHACEFALDEGDNFCRRCGMAAGRAPLPAVRSTTDLSSWRPNVPPVVKGAAVMAAGTLGQFVFRRALHSLVGGRRGGSSQLVRIFRPERDGLEDEAQIITETITMKRVRIRRQP